MESVGFKEWSLVCDALGCGEQSIILRKGGIAEGREGFSFRHREFFLFPTFFHEQVKKVRKASANLPVAGDTIAIRWYAKTERVLRIDSLGIAEFPGPAPYPHARSCARTFRPQRRGTSRRVPAII
jgi:hypothetical protein